jgi:hypothetical protein
MIGRARSWRSDKFRISPSGFSLFRPLTQRGCVIQHRSRFSASTAATTTGVADEVVFVSLGDLSAHRNIGDLKYA